MKYYYVSECPLDLSKYSKKSIERHTYKQVRNLNMSLIKENDNHFLRIKDADYKPHTENTIKLLEEDFNKLKLDKTINNSESYDLYSLPNGEYVIYKDLLTGLKIFGTENDDELPIWCICEANSKDFIGDSELEIRYIIDNMNIDFINMNISSIINKICISHYSDLLEYFIKKNIFDFNSDLNHNEYTSILQYIVKCKKYLLVKILLKNIKDININKADNYGRTPLYIAASNRDYKMAELLMDYKADPNIKSTDNVTTLDIIEQNKDYHIRDLILSHKSGQRLKKLSLLHIVEDERKNKVKNLMSGKRLGF